ncbi:uncharacterized protein LOC142544415 [Primulina tabacum]|uniref:uncharacterized protein LOC142544415 n=1 Tax=Primulina tabacum TaxID=48773 RepID=UPI003F5ABFCC
MVNANYKLEFKDTGAGKLKFGLDDIDSIEDTYGICLLEYVISGKPPTAALFDLVRRRGSDIHFQTHDSGWIVFTFLNVEVRDRILGGGSYMVYEYHLFLKEMPRCFRFRDEDMNSMPLWVQIHVLPPDCWNFNILSKLACRLGNPIHMDMLTHDRKRIKYARVLIEMEASKPKLLELEIELPFEDVMIKFEYEQDIKFCDVCHRAGDASVSCVRAAHVDMVEEGLEDAGNKFRSRSRSVAWRKSNSRGRSRIGKP